MKIIIVGSGFAGVTCAEKLRALAPKAEISLITCEHDGFYSRPLLSHGFSKPDIEHSIILKPFEVLRQNAIDVISGATVTHIQRSNKTVNVNDGQGDTVLPYDKLILAQGSAAFVPPPFLPNRGCFELLNSLSDLKKLKALRATLGRPHWALIGGGLIGCEIASDLAAIGDKVTLYHATDRLMERQLTVEDSVKLLNVLQSSGVEVLLQQAVTGFQKNNHKVMIASQTPGVFDLILVACGFKPRTDLAAAAGLKVERGISVNNYLQTSDPDIFAVGDVAQLPDNKLYAFILPIRSQAQWLAAHLTSPSNEQPWEPPVFKPKAKVHGFMADNPLPF